MVQDGGSCQLNSSSAWTLGGCAWGQSMRAIESSTRAGGWNHTQPKDARRLEMHVMAVSHGEKDDRLPLPAVQAAF